MGFYTWWDTLRDMDMVPVNVASPLGFVLLFQAFTLKMEEEEFSPESLAAGDQSNADFLCF